MSWRKRLGDREKEISQRPNCNRLMSYDIHNHTLIRSYLDYEAGVVIMLRVGVGWFGQWDFYHEFQVGTYLKRKVSWKTINQEITNQLRLAQEDFFSKAFGPEAAEKLDYERKFFTQWLDPEKYDRISWGGKEKERLDHLSHLKLFEWEKE